MQIDNTSILGIRFILTELHSDHLIVTSEIKRRCPSKLKRLLSNSFTGFPPMPESF